MDPIVPPPEPPPRKFSPLRITLGLLGLAFLLTIGALALMIRDLGRERDRERARADGLVSVLRKETPVPITPEPPPAASPAPPGTISTTPAAAAPPRAPRISADDEMRELRTRSKAFGEFRQRHYAEAESQFSLLLPEGYPYIALSRFARGQIREGLEYFAKALAGSPLTFKTVNPRGAFGSVEEYLRVWESLEDRVRSDPLDGEARTALAWILYHEKGPAYAKALLVEASSLEAETPATRVFLDHVDD